MVCPFTTVKDTLLCSVQVTFFNKNSYSVLPGFSLIKLQKYYFLEVHDLYFYDFYFIQAKVNHNY